MGLPGFDELRRDADAERPAVKVIAAGGADSTVLLALHEAQRRGWVVPLLTGNDSEIGQVAEACNVPLDSFTVIGSANPAAAAVAEIRAGNATILMKGQIPTPDLMKSVLHQEYGLRTGKTLCQIVLMEILRDQRRFLMGDTGLCIQPDFRQKSEILEHQIAAARYLATLPWVDAGRIGIWGWSFGGYLSTSCILKGNNVFKMAVAVDPGVTRQWDDKA